MLILFGWLLVASGAVMLLIGWTFVFGIITITIGLGVVAFGARRPAPLEATGEEPAGVA